jgi:uncharacterized membrane protein
VLLLVAGRAVLIAKAGMSMTRVVEQLWLSNRRRGGDRPLMLRWGWLELLVVAVVLVLVLVLLLDLAKGVRQRFQRCSSQGVKTASILKGRSARRRLRGGLLMAVGIVVGMGMGILKRMGW